MAEVKPAIVEGVISQHEAFWVNRLNQQETIELPYGSRRRTVTQSAPSKAVHVLGATEIAACHGDAYVDLYRGDFLTAALVAYLARLSDRYNFDVGFSDSFFRGEAARSGDTLASHVPLQVELDPLKGLEVSLESLQRELESMRRRGPFVRDIVSRHSELGAKWDGHEQPVWSIVIEQGQSGDKHVPMVGSDLIVLCAEDGTEMHWLYDTDVFSSEDVKTMRRQFITFLRNAVADIHEPIARISLLRDSDYHQLTVEWNDTQTDYPRDRCIHQVFEAQAARTPDHVALIFEQEELTYADLNRRANQLAHWLRSRGVGPDVHVGIAVERSLEMLVGLYAIMKAGGVYVPLDPSYPQERLADIVQDADISIMLTQAHFRHSLPTHEAQVLCLDTDWDTLIAGLIGENPDCKTTMGNLAYTIYTSGSTGKPKGVMNTHLGILNRLFWMQDMFGLTESDRVLHKTPFSFDVSVWELFWPLMYGATLVVARPEGHKDNDYLVKTISERQVTLMHFVPSMLELFLQAKNVQNCRSLRDVICSGEALSADLQRRFFAHLDARLHNLYGPTEAAVDVTSWECRREDKSNIVPIGRPVANTQIYILDRFMCPVPVGIPGELHIGGVQVARGYLNRPVLTTERFVSDPFSDDPHARLYKTGDLARYRPDGNIEYLGRLDHQVKLQGFRIELGEIESLLSRHPAIRSTVVVVHGDTAADKRLVAYLVPEVGSPLSDGPLRDYLRRRLPNHMVPAAFVWVEALPLTPNGKVDRRHLPAPTGKRPLAGACQVPGSEMERIIVGVWRDVLKMDKVGVEDNFFDLGGNSFSSILAANRLREVLGVEVPVTRLFQYPTVASLAQCLRSNSADQATSRVVEHRAQRRKMALSRQRRLVK